MTFEQWTGALLGGAIGDGWGSGYEGRALPALLTWPERLSITDDTQLTLATCEEILESGRVDPERIAARFVAWYRARRLSGLGSSTLKALRDLELGAHWALSGAQGERAAGNGAAMRAAPLALLLDPQQPEQRALIRDVCRITHRHDEAYCGALAVIAALRLAGSTGYDLAHLLDDVARQLPDSQVRGRLDLLASLDPTLSPAEIGKAHGHSGFVVESVPLALWAARAIRSQPFVDVVGNAIRAGGDCDTIGAITGQIAGMVVGISGLPATALARLAGGEKITAVAHDFAAFASSAMGVKT